jgi:hypothetical protein
VGPALTFTSLIPDLHHYSGRGGRVFPLWRDREASEANIPANLLTFLRGRYKRAVSAEDLVAYVAAIAAHPAFTSRFQPDLVKPGLRIPLTADGKLFAEAAELGRRVVWLHTFGERFADPKHDRPAKPPRLPKDIAPRIPAAGAISQEPAEMPDSIDYDVTKRRLLVGRGYVERVSPEVWNYEVSGKQVLRQWFSYRKANRERPIIGDRRPPSKLGNVQPDHWLAEYTTELINLLNVIGGLVDLQASQAGLLERVCSGPTITADQLPAADAVAVADRTKRRTKDTDSPGQMNFLD